MRLCIAGVPRAGKTTLAGQGPHVRHTDDVKGEDWSEASEAVSHWLDEPGPYTIEGVAVPRALRKWLARNPTGKPCDVVVWMGTPLMDLSPGQATMGKGALTVMSEILPELHKRGVHFEVKS